MDYYNFSLRLRRADYDAGSGREGGEWSNWDNAQPEARYIFRATGRDCIKLDIYTDMESFVGWATHAAKTKLQLVAAAFVPVTKIGAAAQPPRPARLLRYCSLKEQFAFPLANYSVHCKIARPGRTVYKKVKILTTTLVWRKQG